ncbi:MAG: hypothetical protein PSV22_03450 [Pseudolabrys sp.]|nr:hypothetical protein [Pseudolabrys sp.]
MKTRKIVNPDYCVHGHTSIDFASALQSSAHGFISILIEDFAHIPKRYQTNTDTGRIQAYKAGVSNGGRFNILPLTTGARAMAEEKKFSVAEAIMMSFLQARAQQQDVLSQWNKVSYRIGPRVPASLLLMSVQQQGETDAVLRCIEDELADPGRRKEIDFVCTPYLTLTTYWIGAVYEVLRLLRDRKLLSEPDAEPLFRDFELLRITLEKHEIAKDRDFTEPQSMVRFPQNNNDTDYYTYDPKSPTRGHIMPSGLSARGSMMWQAIEAKTKTPRWVERRALSERILLLWGQP